MSSSESPSPTKSLSDLRNFRLLKKPSIGHGGSSGSSNSPPGKNDPPRSVPIPGRKRIQMMADSDSDTDVTNAAPKKVKMDITVKEKEERYIATSKIAVDYDTMDIQDSLVRKDWNVSEAVKYLSENCKKKGTSSKNRSSNGATTNGSSHSSHSSSHSHHSKSSKSKSSKSKDYEGSDSDGGEAEQKKDLVYDSDESDSEISNELTPQRKKVFDFFNTATFGELQTVRSCSDKKASCIVDMRPFQNWLDLVKKLGNNKSTSNELLNNCQDLINKQNNVVRIMNKCNAMVQKLERTIAAGGGMVEQPKNLNPEFKLAEYQLVGLNWLTIMYSQKMNGILADEMGLGKTIQIIAFLAYLKENNLSKGAHLIVVPSSTLDNWESELAKWCPSLIVEKYYGSQAERKSMRIRYAKLGFKGFDIVLTTYNIVSSTPEERKMFRVCKLHYVIFDEAHMLKNMTSQRYSNLITINAEMRILLTGTPLQNNLLELMSLLCFVMPSFFSKNIEDIKSLFQKKMRTEEDSSLFAEGQVERAKRIMKPFVLRRLKKDVLSFLPKKTEVVKVLPMTDEQAEQYKELVAYYRRNPDPSSNNIPGSSIMMDMRKLANHPLLQRTYFTDERITEFSKQLARTDSYKKTNPQYIFEELAIMSDFQVYQICHKHEMDDVTIPDELICGSGKFRELDVLLPSLKAEGHRTLIFSQFTMMLDIVEKYLEIRGYEYLRLDGSTAVNERQDMINDFNEDPNIFIFLISTKAGGMGINLTAADTAIIHDIDFNPYNDKQAEDRCHRMGQEKPVTIYRLVSKETIEEGMLMIANEKLKLEQEIHSQKDDVKEHKSMVRLLTMALGTDQKKAELLMTPPPKKHDGKNCKRREDEDSDF